MQTSNYVALSGQLALERRMAALAQNIANANSAGYRAEVLDFKTVLSQTGALPTSFVLPSGTHIDPSSGGLSLTKNPLDIAIRGDSFFAYQGASGTTTYSRDGRLSLASDGRLINANGDALTDAGGAPLQLDPTMPDITIAGDGSILQGGVKKGAVGLYQVNLEAGAQRAAGAAFIPNQPPQPVSDFSHNGVIQGYVEESNVNAATSMTSLIELTRAFEAVTQMSEQTSDAQKNAIDVLGSR